MKLLWSWNEIKNYDVKQQYLSIHYAPGIIPSTIQVLTLSIHTTTLSGGYCYPLLTDEETKAEREAVLLTLQF